MLSVSESKQLLSMSKHDFSLLNINIRSLSKNFENFKLLLENLRFPFKIICITETWYQGDIETNSKFSIPGYKIIHQPRANSSHSQGGGVCIFVHDSLNFKTLNYLSIIQTVKF